MQGQMRSSDCFCLHISINSEQIIRTRSFRFALAALNPNRVWRSNEQEQILASFFLQDTQPCRHPSE